MVGSVEGGMTDRTQVLEALATETLHAFAVIADAADGAMHARQAGTDSFAVVNEFTATRAVANLARIQNDQAATYRQLREEPAIARVVVIDEDDRTETVFICRGQRVNCAVSLCSNLAPKGRLAALKVGDSAEIRLPGGSQWYEVVERAVFKPIHRAGAWDARNAVVQTEQFGPLSIASLRELLARAGWSDDDLDVLERQLAEDDAAANVVEGVRRSTLYAMQLRDQPILDQFQDEIFRLPIDRQLAILGPAGTGKTTTLVRRLRQKIDADYLNDDEIAQIEEAAESGLPHAQSWLMFTPTDLLKHYVREAFAREGVPAPDSRIRTWDEHRRDLARRSLPILKSSTGGTLVLNDAADLLEPDVAPSQIAWFEDFDAFQHAFFVSQLADQAAVLANSADPAARRIGERIAAVVRGGTGRPAAMLSTLVDSSGELRRLAAELGDTIGEQLRRALAMHLRRDDGFLTNLGRSLLNVGGDDEDDEDAEAENDAEEGDDEPLTPGTRKAAQAAFLRAVRSAAVAQAHGRTAPNRGRMGHVLRWIREQDVTLPELKPLGELAAVQRAARLLIGAPAAYVRGVPGRYRAFRRERESAGRWYRTLPTKAQEVGPLEVDLILLAMLRNARALLDDGGLLRRLGERTPAILGDVRRLQRNQILVDEATDFSPVQLACMRALANGWTDSFVACGDFNQRLTAWGSRSSGELDWVSPGIEVREIDVGYRQSRLLNALAVELAATGGSMPGTRSPEHLDHIGVPPVLGSDLGELDRLIAWLAARIGEIDDALGQMPTVAILVEDADTMRSVATALNEALAPRNLRAVACPDGQVMGQGNDVRVFEVEHIKGLEFEAVFFVNVDLVEQRSPDLFARYLYVGATRAATYLGLTCSTDAIPGTLAAARAQFGQDWRPA